MPEQVPQEPPQDDQTVPYNPPPTTPYNPPPVYPNQETPREDAKILPLPAYPPTPPAYPQAPPQPTYRQQPPAYPQAPPAYPYSAPYYGPTGKSTPVLQVVSLVLGILAVFPGMCFFIFCLPFSVGAIVTGIIGIKQAKNLGQSKAMGIIGLILGLLMTILMVVLLILMIATGGTSGKTTYYSS